MSVEAVILAAGRGSRLGLDVPKPMVTISGRPLIDRALYALYSSGFNPNTITTVINRYPNSHCLLNHLKGDSRYCYQPEPQGTAPAVREYLNTNPPSKHLFVVQGDDCLMLTPSIVQDSLRFHTSANADITILLTSSYDSTHHRKTYQIDSYGNIISIKPADSDFLGERNYFSGISCFKTEFLRSAFTHLDNHSHKEMSLFSLIDYAFVNNLRLKGYRIPGPWTGINTPFQLFQARESAK